MPPSLVPMILRVLLVSAMLLPDLRAQSLVIYGSSVAQGHQAGPGRLPDGAYTWGYAGRVAAQLTQEGWQVRNLSVPGRNTAQGLARFEQDVLPQRPDVVLLGFSLGNEGLAHRKDREVVRDTFLANLASLVERCRAEGIRPVIGLAYPHGRYDAEAYRTLIDTNLRLQEGDVPALHFAGVLDDGQGRWIEALCADPAHPNVEGHLAMYQCIPEGFFSAVLRADATVPRPGSSQRVLHIPSGDGSALRHSLAAGVRAFTLALRVRAHSAGEVLSLDTDRGPLRLILNRDAVELQDRTGLLARVPVENAQAWHEISVVHAWHRNELRLYVDGTLSDPVSGGWHAQRLDLTAPQGADVAHLSLSRTAWNPAELTAWSEGGLPHASLEIYAPLDDAAFPLDSAVHNLALSSARLTVSRDGLRSLPVGPEGLDAIPLPPAGKSP